MHWSVIFFWPSEWAFLHDTLVALEFWGSCLVFRGFVNSSYPLLLGLRHVFRTNVNKHLISSTRAKWPEQHIRLCLIMLIPSGEQHKWLLPCSCLQPPLTYSLLRPDILRALFCNTLRLPTSSFDMADQASRPYKTAVTINLLITFILRCWIANGRMKDDELMVSGISCI